MRILMLVPGFPSNLKCIKGGVHSAVCNLLEGFKKFNIIVRVISINKDLDKEHFFAFSENIEIFYCPEGSLPFHSLNYLFKCSFVIKEHIKIFNPDLIHFEEGNTFLLSKFWGMLNKEQVLTIHGMTFAEGRIKKKYIEKLTWLFNGFVQILFLPRNIIHLSQYSFNNCQDIRIKNQAIIPNAIISDYFELPIKLKTTNKLIYVGVINRRKNLLFLLQSLSQLVLNNRAFCLMVLGDFDDDIYKNEIYKFIDDNGLSNYVNFYGWVAQSELLNYIRDADIMILPSKQETLPMSILETMAAGKVVISSSVGGVPEMIDHAFNGFLFDLSNIIDLTDILNGLYDDIERIKLISNRAREFAFEKYNCDLIACKTVQFYNKILIDKGDLFSLPSLN